MINYEGLIIGASTFFIIGLFHPLVIKGEFYFGQKCKWWFLVGGIIFLCLTLINKSTLGSALLGVTSFSCFWSILEIKEQGKRVKKGWFPSNPKRAASTKSFSRKKS